MKKINIKSLILGIFIGILVSGGVVYGVTLLDSKDVTYTSSDNTFDVSNVESALNELYLKISNKVTFEKIYDFSQGAPYHAFGISRSASFNVDIKSMYPDTYQNYTNDNFIFVSTTARSLCYTAGSANIPMSITPTISYNSTTGILTVSGLDSDMANANYYEYDGEVVITNGYVLLVS